MVELTRRNAFTHLDQSTQRDHGVIAAAHVNAVNVVGGVAAAGLCLHDHVELLGVAFVARHIAPAQQGLDGPGHHIHAHTQVSGFLTVDVDAQLRLVQAQVHVRRDDARVLGDLVEHLPHSGIEVLVAV